MWRRGTCFIGDGASSQNSTRSGQSGSFQSKTSGTVTRSLLHSRSLICCTIGISASSSKCPERSYSRTMPGASLPCPGMVEGHSWRRYTTRRNRESGLLMTRYCARWTRCQMAKAAIRAITANTAIARRFFAAGSGADVFISPSSYADVHTTKESGGLMFSCFTSE